jgi:hypothetical protein
MKFILTKSLQIVTFSLATVGNPVTAHCQTYQFSMPITGAISMGATDVGNWTKQVCTNTIFYYQPQSFCGFHLNFQTLTETIYLDPINFTIRHVGFISVTPSDSEFSIHEYNVTSTTNNQPFPLPPIITYVTNTADITIQLAMLESVLTFDTGPRQLTYNSTSGLYTCDGSIVINPVTVNGSYSIVTGNKTNSGTIHYTLSRLPGNTGSFVTFNAISVTNYPTSLFLSGLGLSSSGTPPCFIASPSVIADYTATNGFHALLYAGGVTWVFGTILEAGEWKSGPITATNTANLSPIITQQPQPLVAHAHDRVSFSVTASGALPLGYQWSLNSINITGANNSTLTIPDVAPSNLGDYLVVLTNAFGTNVSSSANLAMYPFIAKPFAGAITYWGKAATLSIEAWGTGPLSYQWFKDGSSILGAITNSLSLSSIQFTNAGLYSVVVSGPLGNVTNSPAQVVVNAAGVSLGFCPALTIDGVIGYPYSIDRTADLANTNAWVRLTNLTLTQPVQLWVDTNVNASSPFNSKYFYRVLPGQ